MIAGILVASVFDSLASTVTPRWVRISVSLVAIASAAISPIATAAGIAQHDPAVHFTYAVDSIPKYRWDVACIVQQAEPNATIVPPYGDYGSRQIVYYHRYADPVVKAKHLTFRYFFAAPANGRGRLRRGRLNPSDRSHIFLLRQLRRSVPSLRIPRRRDHHGRL